MFGESPYYIPLILISSLASLLLFFAERRRHAPEPAVPAAKLAVLVPIAAVVGARLGYFLFRADEFIYDYGMLNVFDLRFGGCLMYGGVLGALLCAALLARASRVSIAATLDEIAAPGLLAIAVCRLSEYFTPEGIGPLIENEAFAFFPLAVQNEYGEWNLAVFMLEAFAAAVILFVLLRAKPQAAGERIMTALLLFSCCQILLENLRSDSCLRIGFVRVSQVIAVLVLLAVIFLRAREKRSRVRRISAALGCTAVIGVLEWAQDKTNIPNFLLYAVMIALCAAMAFISRKTPKDRRNA